VGHATLLMEMDGTRVLTDPLLRNRLAHLIRQAPPLEPESVGAPDVILISHLHLDHLDLPSLRRLGKDRRLIVPSGSGAFFQRRGFYRIHEMKPGDAVAVNSLKITATPANHSGFRPPIGPAGVPLGFLIAGSRTAYFAGDTDIFPDMADLAGTVDVALLPIWGWGRVLGPGHLDPLRAAEALRLIRPSLAIPIHWGTFAARGVRRRDPSFLVDPPIRFAEHAALLAPQVRVKILQPGDCTTIPPG
jgi:L-ascorbate metabolism protein UlaG (beta-lactamase superfamily)